MHRYNRAVFEPPKSFIPYRSHLERGGAPELFASRVTRTGAAENGRGAFVLYWMQSARRLRSNLALELAAREAERLGLPLLVYESLRPDYGSANDRIHTFVLQGVAGNRRDAESAGISYAFFLPRRREDARGVVRSLAENAALVVTDEYPVFVVREQTSRFVERSTVPLLLVDHNGLLPMRAMPKEQYSAKFFRDRAHRMLDQYWSDVPDTPPQPKQFFGELPFVPWDGSGIAAAVGDCAIDHSIAPVPTAGGRPAALRALEDFVSHRLEGYALRRNREARRTSGLSPYLHFGFIGIHEVARRVLFSDAPVEDIDAFLEEAVIRRELSFNMCLFRRDYDSYSALPEWARKTLDAHRRDRRHPQYSFEELERGETHDEVWNLAQRGLLATGTMHTYLRMLWGKKILEWSASPEAAIDAMLRLHEKYAVDGRDPNTFAGVLWCLGKHDRPWAPERPIFGSVRYMSSESTRKKVDLKAYAALVDSSLRPE